MVSSVRTGLDSWCRGREAAGSLSVLQLRIKRVVLPNRQWRLYPLRNRTVNFVNSSRSNQTPPNTHTRTLSPSSPSAAVLLLLLVGWMLMGGWLLRRPLWSVWWWESFVPQCVSKCSGRNFILKWISLFCDCFFSFLFFNPFLLKCFYSHYGE